MTAIRCGKYCQHEDRGICTLPVIDLDEYYYGGDEAVMKCADYKECK